MGRGTSRSRLSSDARLEFAAPSVGSLQGFLRRAYLIILYCGTTLLYSRPILGKPIVGHASKQVIVHLTKLPFRDCANVRNWGRSRIIVHPSQALRRHREAKREAVPNPRRTLALT